MPLTSVHNLVTFRPSTWPPPGGPWEAEAPRLVINSIKITRRGGLDVDSWYGAVPASDLARIALGPVMFEQPGTVELWYSNAPDSGEAADVTLPLCAIVDVEAAELGMIAGTSVEVPIVYRVTIADHRRAWRQPRGGRLFKGQVNRTPLPVGQTLLTNSEMIAACTTAMGVATATIVADVDAVDPMRDLDWTCAHAASELQSLLEHTGSVYAPLMSGDAQIVKPGNGLLPAFPADRLVRNVLVNSIDRRGNVAILTSAPAVKIRSFNESGSAVPSWQYVAQDPQDGDKWKPLNDIAALGGNHATAWANDLKDVAEDYRGRLREQMYRCIQLDTTNYPRSKVVLMTQAVDVDGNELPPYLKLTTVLQKLANGSFGQQPTNARLYASSVHPQDNVLVFPTPLLKLPSSSTTARRQELTSAEAAIPEASIKPTFSVQAWDASGEAVDVSVFGFSIVGSTVTPLSSSEAKARLTGYRPDTVVLNTPDLVEILVNGGTTAGTRNTEAMAARAATMAANLISDDSGLREIVLKGFYAVEIDAAVSEVTYDPHTLTTRITAYGWPATARQPRYGSGGGFGGVHPSGTILRQQTRTLPVAAQRHRAAAARRGDRTTGRVAESTGRTPAAERSSHLLLATGATAISGMRGRYTATLIGASLNTAAVGNLALTDFGTNYASGGTVEVWFPPDISASSPQLTSTDLLFLDRYPDRHATRGNPLCLVIAVKSGGTSTGGPTAYRVKRVSGQWFLFDGTNTSGVALTVTTIQGHGDGDITYVTSLANQTGYLELVPPNLGSTQYKVLQIVDATGRWGFDYVRASP